MGAIDAIREWEKHDVNVRSYATAQLGGCVAGALGGKEIKANYFLPFDVESSPEEESSGSYNRPTLKTKKVLKDLIKAGVIPDAALGAFIPDTR